MSGKFDEREIPDEKEVIRRQIEALRDHIYSHIIWYENYFCSFVDIHFKRKPCSKNRVIYLLHHISLCFNEKV